MKRQKVILTGIVLSLLLGLGLSFARSNKSTAAVFGRLQNALEASARAAGEVTYSYADYVIRSYGLVAGAKTRDAYIKYNCGGTDPGPGKECDGAPPEAGLLGAVANIANVAGQVIQNSGVKICRDIPTGFSTTAKDNAGILHTIDFQPPAHSVPAALAEGGTPFTKRVRLKYASSGTGAADSAIAIEFNCFLQSVFMAYQAPVGDAAPGFMRKMNLYSGPDASGAIVTDLYLSESNSATKFIRAANAIRLAVNTASSSFQLWTVSAQLIGTAYMGLRSMVNGNYSDNTASVAIAALWMPPPSSATGTNDNIGATGLLGDKTSSFDAATDFDLGTVLTQAPVIVPAKETKQGCMTFPSTMPTSAALCPGKDIINPTVPMLSSMGSFSHQWVWLYGIGGMDIAIDVKGTLD